MFDKTLMDVGSTLVAYCRQNKEAQGLNELYARDAVSVEAAPMGPQGAEMKGIDAIKGKHEWWFGANEVHSASVEGPFFHGPDRFGVIFEMDVTEKATGKRMQAKELGVYTVKNGKIVREEFFYNV